ncbi:MAG TPA: hypothetical protein VJ985_09205 [Gammaproteobacteria bacterium]|nr:hypothetical protein [Gammaproteobacteria bacterium]
MFYLSADVHPREDPTAQKLGEVADMLFRYSRKDFNLRVGECRIEYTDNPRFTLVIDTPRTVRRLLLRRSPFATADAFIRKRVDLEGDFIEGLKLKNDLVERGRTLRPAEKLKLFFHLFRM